MSVELLFEDALLWQVIPASTSSPLSSTQELPSEILAGCRESRSSQDSTRDSVPNCEEQADKEGMGGPGGAEFCMKISSMLFRRE